MTATTVFKPADEHLLLALLRGLRPAAAAAAAGLSPRTARCRRASPEFRARLAEAQARLRERSIELLARSLAAAEPCAAA
jgi:hypothetical protein